MFGMHKRMWLFVRVALCALCNPNMLNAKNNACSGWAAQRGRTVVHVFVLS